MSEITGGCACGAIRFSTPGPLLGMGVCHCTDCQKASGGGPNYVAIIPNGTLKVLQGEPRVYRSKSDSGGEIGRAFCADCGTPLWTATAAEAPIMPVKAGALDDSSGLAPTLHLYTESAPPWHLMHEGLPQFPKMPPTAPPA